MDKFEVVKEIDMNELWEAIWSSEGSGLYWVDAIRKPDGSDINLWTTDWKPNPQDFKLYDNEEGEWKQVTLADLAKAYQIASSTNVFHCGNYRVDDLEDPDECTGDILLQLAVYGEVIYG